ncbi:hypothetical protein B0H66DRAFT_620531 [Apodospora peruviana]|uniref:Uncharacterized protein n=1 Tax=Apodospora peruviana TaxID=516989 RepID=A0AAE0M9C4_9PEZI|nr:hypothetical protein B0H66DRAFT_620531 [Apodospora peruviana]
MASSSTGGVTYDLYLMRRTQDGDRFPHWYLVTVAHNPHPPPMIKCTRYHSINGPTDPLNRPYEVAVQANANFRSQNLVAEQLIRQGLTEKDLKTIVRVCHSIQPHQCQKYVVCVLAELERRDLVPRGHAVRYAAEVRMSERVRAFEATHPPPDPVGIQLPPSWPRASPVPSVHGGSAQEHGSTGGGGASSHGHGYVQATTPYPPPGNHQQQQGSGGCCGKCTIM